MKRAITEEIKNSEKHGRKGRENTNGKKEKIETRRKILMVVFYREDAEIRRI
jgi:hypothetical protein